MSILSINLAGATAVTLTAGVATDLVGTGTTGVSIKGISTMSFQLGNAGGVNNITALSVYFTDDDTGTRWAPADGAVAAGFAAIVPGGSLDVRWSDLCYRRMRIVATSTGGTTATLDLLGTPVAVTEGV